MTVPDIQSVAARFNLPTLFWERFGDDPQDWKGPRDKGWNEPSRVYDWSRFDPTRHNTGVLTGRPIAEGRYLADCDIDKLNEHFARAFLPEPRFAFWRPGKPLSHLFITLPEAIAGRVQFKGADGKPYVELRGTGHQSMAPNSLHTPPDQRVQFLATDAIPHVESRDAAVARMLDYSVAHLVHDSFPRGFHHDERLALAGYLLKQARFDARRVERLLQAVCAYQANAGVPDMSDYDIEDAANVVASTIRCLERKEPVGGWQLLKETNPEFAKQLARWLNLQGGDGAVRLDDFLAYMPTHTYLFIPSREFWPASSVDSRLDPIPRDRGKPLPASEWLDEHRPVEQMVWAPGLPMLVEDRLVSEGGWIERPGCSCVNLYRPPHITLGDAAQAEPWLQLVRFLYPQHADHIVRWLAHRAQRPQEKVNHALVLGGMPGIGKDTVLEPVKHAIGPWNFVEISPTHLLGRFNGFVKSVILRVSEARDLGELNRYDFYERMKVYAAAPPDVLRCDEKNVREHSVFNICGVIITTNHETQGLYLPPDDRRHFVAWSAATPQAFADGYWRALYGWYANGGIENVAAYLTAYDLSEFDPKAPPPKTEAFWNIVDANRSAEDSELADVLDALDNPVAITLQTLSDKAPSELQQWLRDRKNSRLIPHRMKTAGYARCRNKAAADGQWKVGGKRQAIYVKVDLTVPQQERAAADLAANVAQVDEVDDPGF